VSCYERSAADDRDGRGGAEVSKILSNEQLAEIREQWSIPRIGPKITPGVMEVASVEDILALLATVEKLRELLLRAGDFCEYEADPALWTEIEEALL